MMEPVSRVDQGRLNELLEYWRGRLERVQPVEPAQKTSADYGGRKPAETLHPDTLGKPPEPKVTYVKFPEFMTYAPERMLDALKDNGVVIQIHPEQFRELPKELLDLMGGEGINPRVNFFLWEETGRRVDRLA